VGSTYLRLVRGAEDLRAGGALARFFESGLGFGASTVYRGGRGGLSGAGRVVRKGSSPSRVSPGTKAGSSNGRSNMR
jgi:hypothetical protein